MNNKDLALYLRCYNASPDKRPRKCDKTCSYFIMEKVRPDLPCPPDIVENGIGYWTGCDYEKINEDAAKHIESLEALLRQLRWERDIAISQLEELGLGLGEKVDKVKSILEKAEKYKWHDLRKNPDDLPENGKLVETIYHLKIHPDIPMNHIHGHEYGGEGFNKHTAKIVVAWRYVEPFMEEKE